VLVSERGPVIIDWTNATRGDPAADVARTRLMFRLGALAPGSPAVIRLLEPAGRGVFARRYLAAYHRCRAVDQARVDEWEVVRAADRFGEGIEAEYPALTAFLERAVTLSA
jgi:aminoglycoside phosphotransferase (APT) family kinase protein